MNAIGREGILPVRRRTEELAPQLLLPLQGKRILLVEDNEMNLEVASEFLEQVGIILSIATNGQIALDKLSQQHFDLVLMDCQMPVMDGYQATQAIRKRPELANLPVVAMTANAMAGDRDMCIRAGMNDHIAKPIEVNVLYQTLLKYLAPASETVAVVTSAQTMPSNTKYGAGNSAEQIVLLKWPEHPELDIDRGLQLVQHSARLYQRIFDRFVSSQRNVVEQVRKAIAANQVEDAVRIAHTLKGLAGNLSSAKLVELARLLELHLTEGAPFEAELVQIQQLVASICDAIEYAKPAAVNPAEPQDVDLLSTEDLRAALQALRQNLDDADASAVAKIDALKPQVSSAMWQALSPALSMINQYQFDEAIDLIDDVIAQLG